MNPQIHERRLYMLRMYERLSLAKTIELTAEEFHCKKGTLYTDWSRRSEWLKELCNLEEPEALTRQGVIGLFNIIREAEEERRRGDNSNVKLGALKLKAKIWFKMIDLSRDLGYEKLAERVDKLETMAKKGVFVP